jgi:hypothetical protein
MEEIQRDTPPEIQPEVVVADPQRLRARKRLNDASARVTAEARIESREQVREIMGWA